MSNPRNPANVDHSNGQNQGLDPLEELARIMNDTKDTRGTGEGANAPTEQTKLNDPLDLGLGDQGLAELFGTPKPASNAGGVEAAQQPGLDPLLQDLNFADDELSAPQVSEEPWDAEPAPLAPIPVEQDVTQARPQPTAQPMLTDHLTPRAGEAPADSDPLEVDLLAAMDELALDEPAHAGAAPAAAAQVLPTSQPADDYQMDFAASPDMTGDLQAEQPLVAGPEFEQAAIDEPGDSKGPSRLVLIALGALAVLGVGGVLAFGIVGGDNAADDAPQLIASQASEEDKVEPVVAGEDTQTRPGDAVFSNLDETEQGTATTPRVVLPQPGSAGLQLNENQRLPSVDIAPAPPGSTASRTVRTVTVRADGTVVESTSQPTVATQDVQAQAPSARPVEVVAVDPAPAINTVEQTAQDAARAALAEATRAVAQGTGAAPAGSPPAPVARPAGITPVQTQPIAVTPVAVQTQAQPVTPATPEPVQLTAPQAAPTQPVAPQAVETAALAPATSASVPAGVGSGDFIVQLASLRSQDEAQATFNRLQNRFGSILGGFGPNIQRADLGDRGVYHRVRLGPMDRASADSLCQRYQAAGGDCFVQRQ